MLGWLIVAFVLGHVAAVLEAVAIGRWAVRANNRRLAKLGLTPRTGPNSREPIEEQVTAILRNDRSTTRVQGGAIH